MHIPMRAHARVSCNAQARRTEPPNHIACDVELHEVERNAARIGPVQADKPRASLLKAGAEAARQYLHVVTQFPRRGDERIVGHDRRSRQIVRKSDTAPLTSRGGRWIGTGHSVIDCALKTEQCRALCCLEGALGY